VQSISTLTKAKGKNVLIRVDYNVPIKNGKIVDVRRIISSYQTIDMVLKKGGRPILITHQGEGKESLAPIAKYLSKRYKIVFFTDRLGKGTRETLSKAKEGAVVLLENIRRYKGEKQNDPKFTTLLASLGDVYVNDAFPVSHRAHASIVGVPKLLPSFAGVQLQAEITALTPVLAAKAHPFLFILGGAKFGTKIPLLERFGELADGVVIAGAILNNFYKVSGFEVGKSVVEAGYDEQIRKLLKSSKLLLPTDVVILRKGKKHIVSIDDVGKQDKICDIGPASTERIIEKIYKAKLVVWNGPTGWYEAGFDTATMAIGKALTKSRAKAIIGGGDTAAVIEKMLAKLPLKQKQIFISTGGGATLDFLAKGTLPGVQSL